MGKFNYENKVIFYGLAIYITLGAYYKLKILSQCKNKPFDLQDHSLPIIGLLILLNLINISLTKPSFVNNLSVDQADRFRGIYIYSLLFMMSLLHRHGFFKTALIGLMGFIMDGGRAASLLYVLMAQVARYVNPRMFLIVSISIPISIYTSAVLLGHTGHFQDLPPDIYIKLNSFYTAFQGIGIFGNDFQDGRDPVSKYGFHFLPADAGILGAIYELGILPPVAFVLMNFILLRKLMSFNFSVREKKMIIYFFLISLGYNMTVDLASNAIGLFVLLTLLSYSRSERKRELN
jgi:hypothetical protein